MSNAIEPGNVKNFVNAAVNIREGAIEFLDEQWLKALATAEEGETPDVKSIAIRAIDNAIVGTLDLFSNRYPEAIIDTKVSLGEDGVKEVQIVVADDLSQLYFDQVSS